MHTRDHADQATNDVVGARSNDFGQRDSDRRRRVGFITHSRPPSSAQPLGSLQEWSDAVEASGTTSMRRRDQALGKGRLVLMMRTPTSDGYLGSSFP